jgi:hypothetical protein
MLPHLILLIRLNWKNKKFKVFFQDHIPIETLPMMVEVHNLNDGLCGYLGLVYALEDECGISSEQ